MDRPDGWSFVQEIKMLRRQMLVHSHIYYVLDDNIISDHEWQDRAFRLARLQQKAIERTGHCNVGFYDEAFEGWDGSSGAFLPLNDSWVLGKARSILEKCRG